MRLTMTSPVIYLDGSFPSAALRLIVMYNLFLHENKCYDQEIISVEVGVVPS